MTAIIAGPCAVFLDGPCPFLTCLETGPHGHDTCRDCGAVKFGNLFCAGCRPHWPGGDPLADDMTAAVRRHLTTGDQA